MRFCVISDLHLYSKELGIDSPDFFEMCKRETKILHHSEKIFDKIIEDILADGIRTVFLTGDFTANGEEVNHRALLRRIRTLKDAGVELYIIPGNHDFGTQHAFQYPDAGGTESVPTFSRQEYESHYSEFGLSSACSADPSSFSYLKEFREFYCYFLDTATAATSEHEVTIKGRLAESTLNWIGESHSECINAEKPIFAVMHHGIIPDFPYMGELFPDFLLDNREEVVDLFSQIGVSIVLSGHHHANSISRIRKENFELTDIQCGSPVTYPLSYKIFDVNSGKIFMQTRFSKPQNSANGLRIESEALQFLTAGISHEIRSIHRKLYPERTLDSESLHLIAQIFLAYYSGFILSDEHFDEIKAFLERTEAVDSAHKQMFSDIARYFRDYGGGLVYPVDFPTDF